MNVSYKVHFHSLFLLPLVRHSPYLQSSHLKLEEVKNTFLGRIKPLFGSQLSGKIYV